MDLTLVLFAGEHLGKKPFFISLSQKNDRCLGASSVREMVCLEVFISCPSGAFHRMDRLCSPASSWSNSITRYTWSEGAKVYCSSRNSGSPNILICSALARSISRLCPEGVFSVCIGVELVGEPSAAGVSAAEQHGLSRKRAMARKVIAWRRKKVRLLNIISAEELREQAGFF
jgi:hypothetical protein